MLSLRNYQHDLIAHSHDHPQLVFGLSGQLEFEIAGRGSRIGERGLAIVPAAVHHACASVTGSHCLVLDVPSEGWLRQRLGHELQAGALVTVSVAIGALLSWFGAPEPLVLGITSVVAAIGAVLGGVLGNQVARNERTLGTVAGAGLGAAAGSYIGCNQQRTRAIAQANASQFRANSNLRIRSGPGTGYRQAGSLSAGQPFTAVASQGDWVQIAGGGWVNANYVSRY